MDRVWPGIPSAEALQVLSVISESEFFRRLSGNNISKKRLKLLYEIVTSKVSCELYKKIDCCRFALSLLEPENVNAYNCGGHDCSAGDLYEYDPVKNGANIIKHGLSFSEVVSYSEKFGTVSVICRHPRDGHRAVMFSDLDTGVSGQNLSFPIKKITDVIYTMSIGTLVNRRFRFISARRLSTVGYRKDMKQAFKGILDDNPSEKDRFVDACVYRIENDLFRK